MLHDLCRWGSERVIVKAWEYFKNGALPEAWNEAQVLRISNDLKVLSEAHHFRRPQALWRSNIYHVGHDNKQHKCMQPKHCVTTRITGRPSCRTCAAPGAHPLGWPPAASFRLHLHSGLPAPACAVATLVCPPAHSPSALLVVIICLTNRSWLSYELCLSKQLAIYQETL
jgi:hypothetical protein